MLIYILRRVLLLLPLLFGLTVIVFMIARLLPGDPAAFAAGPYATQADIERLTREFGLDQPLWVQYFRYLGGILQGDWGTSIITRRPVFVDLQNYLPATIELIVAALLIAVIVGIPVGLVSAVFRNRWPDALARLGALVSISMPRFFLALLLQLLFAMWLGILPLSGRFPMLAIPPPPITGMLTIDCLLAGDLRAFGTAVAHLTLPALAMALSALATISRMMRASTIEVLNEDYVLTERALGLPRRKILFKYVLKNSMSSTLTTIGLYVGWMLGGTVLVETVFDWPGIGLYATQAILAQDYMPIIGVTLIIGVIFLAINLIVDVLYGVINPKVKYS
jgi:peptide/nickel transport system permease protein